MATEQADGGSQEAGAASGGGKEIQKEAFRLRKEDAKARKSLKEAVTSAMKRWGGGVPQHLRDQISAAARFDKFTERAKRAMVLAQEEAHRYNHNYIGTEHILLGLIHEGDGIAAKVLTSMEIGLDEVRRGVEFVIGRGDKHVEG